MKPGSFVIVVVASSLASRAGVTLRLPKTEAPR